MKIVLTDVSTVTKGDLSFDFLERLGEVTYYDITAEDQAAERIRDADIVICNKTPLNRNNLSEAKNLKYIGLFATGYNNIDIDYCRKRGIPVCNAPAYSTDSVAQLTFALILEIVNRVRDYRDLVDKGDWIKSRTFSMFPIALMELKGKTLGIIGCGSIGEKTAEIAHAFGMRVIAYNRSPKAVPNVSFTDLETVFKESDIVSLHCPLNEQSKNLINKETISKMKDGAILINTARGPIVDEAALAEALSSGKLLAAGVDVLQTEPMTPDCPLYGIENCIITPHIAWAALETRERLLGIVEDNLNCFLKGETKNNVCLNG
ncbi:MAG: D-2-hydroxyacid dehydrogenase [Firmicutes bacterium]|nr:D-2-hydroxyacid dehydrogenase [[Eubacterium] siraeum]MCM1488273.1 D-2-hydroxyacid dehydrogenase [Bacillota bacterium]